MRVEKVTLNWGDINMANLELEKLILHFEQSNKAEGKSSKTVPGTPKCSMTLPSLSCQRDRKLFLLISTRQKSGNL